MPPSISSIQADLDKNAHTIRQLTNEIDALSKMDKDEVRGRDGKIKSKTTVLNEKQEKQNQLTSQLKELKEYEKATLKSK